MKKKFIGVPTRFITSFDEPLPFDVYLERIDGKYTNIYKKNSSHDEQQIARYEAKNIKYMYVCKEDKILFEEFILKLSDAKFLEKDQIIDVIKAGLELNFEYVETEKEDLNTNLELAMTNVKNSLYLLQNDIQSAIEIFKALASNSNLLKHSYMVSLFSIVLAKKLNFNSDRMLLNIGLGALIHDIGLTRINNDILVKPNLNAREWDELKDHCHLGLRIMDYHKCINTEVRSIVIQHHEQYNGRGYPNRLNNTAIYPPAKIVAIADGFCSLISHTSYRDTNKTPREALEIMRDDLGHYDPEYLEAFSEMILKK